MGKFAIMKHPIHPAVVALPIGLMTWTVVADVIYLISDKDKMWYDIATYTGLAAVITGLLAALPGFGDYFTMQMGRTVRRIAMAHMLLNLAVVTAFAVAFLLMLDDNAAAGTNLAVVVVLHLAAFGALGLSGWLGGEMVYVHHLAVAGEEPAAEVQRRAPIGRTGPQPR
jgi:uncharacterized membrane protein